MRIGILGSGEVGRTLGTSLVSLGHEVMMASRMPAGERITEWVKGAGPNARAVTFAEAAAEGELLFNGLRGAVSVDVIGGLSAAATDGKTLIDIANDFSFTGPVPVVNVPQTDSLAERIQRAAPQLRVVKALNTINARVMVAPKSLDGPHDLLMCGDDATAKANVVAFLREWFGWENIIDLGKLECARGIEAYLGLWLRLRLHLGTSLFNIHVVTAQA